MEAGELAVDRLDVGCGSKARSHDGRQRRRSSPRLRRAVAILRLDGRGRHDRGQSLRRVAATPAAKAGKSRDHVPSLDVAQGVWTAVEEEPMRDLIRFLNLIASRLSEAAGLVWGEVDLGRGWIRIAASPHEERQGA